jgi:probable HAF family extracellular repeat protein
MLRPSALIAACMLSTLAVPHTASAGSELPALEFVKVGLLPGANPPFGGTVYGINPDGTFAAGQSQTANGNRALRWVSGDGVSMLMDGTYTMTTARGISSDGQSVVGTVSSPGINAEAGLWRNGEPIQGLGIISGDFFASAAFGISGDGSTVIGWARSVSSGVNDFEAFRWTDDDGMVGLGHISGGSFSQANGVSYDGSVITGVARTAANQFFAFRWTEEDGMVSLGDLPGALTNSGGRGISADGSTIVGNAYSHLGQEAFRWTEEDGMVGLGILNFGRGDDGGGPSFFSMALAASADGSMIGGNSSSTAPGGSEAFIWDQANGMRSLSQVLTNEYGIDLDGWRLMEVNSIHADEDGIIALGGTALKPNGQPEGFIVRRIISAGLPGDVNGDGVVDLNDLNLVLVNFGQTTSEGDANGDGVVDLNDLNLVLTNFGATAG